MNHLIVTLFMLSLFSLVCCELDAKSGQKGNLEFCYKRAVRLVHISAPEVKKIQKELAREALLDSRWDRKRGKVKRSSYGGQNEFVSIILKRSENFRALLAKCPNKPKFNRLEKVLISKMKGLDLPADVREMGRAGDKVPYDALLSFSQRAVKLSGLYKCETREFLQSKEERLESWQKDRGAFLEVLKAHFNIPNIVKRSLKLGKKEKLNFTFPDAVLRIAKKGFKKKKERKKFFQALVVNTDDFGSFLNKLALLGLDRLEQKGWIDGYFAMYFYTETLLKDKMPDAGKFEDMLDRFCHLN